MIRAGMDQDHVLGRIINHDDGVARHHIDSCDMADINAKSRYAITKQPAIRTDGADMMHLRPHAGGGNRLVCTLAAEPGLISGDLKRLTRTR